MAEVKRSGPPARRTPLAADPDKTRAWQDRSRRRLPARSKKRIAEAPTRAAVRAEVLDRDRGCRARGIAPGPCAARPGRAPLEVHEVVSRARRPGGHLDPENCLALCPGHHDWVTEHPTDAEALGLSAPSGT